MQTVRMTPVVGLPQLSGWSQVVDHAVSPELHLVCSIAVMGEMAGSVGREIVAHLLESAPHSAEELYETLEYIVHEARKRNLHLALAVGLFLPHRCFCAALNSTVILKRSDKIGTILHAKNNLGVMEGKIQLDDTFVLVTEQAEQFLETIELQFQKGFDSDGVITSVVPAVHSLPDSSLSALAFVSVIERSTPIFVEPDPATSVLEEVASVAPPHRLHLTNYPESVPETEDVTERDLPPQPAKPSPFANYLPVIQQKGKIALQNLLSAVTKARSLQGLVSKKTYVDGQVSQQTWRKVIIAAIAIIGIIVLIFIWVSINKRAQAKADALVAPYKEKISVVEQQAKQNPIPARDTASSLVEELTKLQADTKEHGSKKEYTAVTNTLAQAQGVYTSISGKEEFSELPIFYDLRLAVPNFVSMLTTIQGNLGVFIDTQNKELVSLQLENKQVTEKKLDTFSELRSVSPLESSSIAILGNGVTSVDLTSDAAPTTVKEGGDSNHDATLVNTFGTYIYIFNPEKHNIYRYAKSKDSYSDPIGWLQDPLGIDFDSVTSMMIDGDVWLGNNQGIIKKFTSGKAAPFIIMGLEEKFSSSIKLFTNENAANLYILEPAKHRLVVLSKEGQFLKEVKSNSLASATGIFANEALKKAFIVSGSIVYEVAL